MVDAGRLVGSAEIADRLRLTSAATVNQWRRRHADFPTPVAVLKMGAVWDWRDVEEWAMRTHRLPPGLVPY